MSARTQDIDPGVTAYPNTQQERDEVGRMFDRIETMLPGCDVERLARELAPHISNPNCRAIIETVLPNLGRLVSAYQNISADLGAANINAINLASVLYNLIYAITDLLNPQCEKSRVDITLALAKIIDAAGHQLQLHEKRMHPPIEPEITQ